MLFGSKILSLGAASLGLAALRSCLKACSPEPFKQKPHILRRFARQDRCQGRVVPPHWRPRHGSPVPGPWQVAGGQGQGGGQRLPCAHRAARPGRAAPSPTSPKQHGLPPAAATGTAACAAKPGFSGKKQLRVPSEYKIPVKAGQIVQRPHDGCSSVSLIPTHLAGVCNLPWLFLSKLQISVGAEGLAILMPELKSVCV